jgi:hypothetical protein
VFPKLVEIFSGCAVAEVFWNDVASVEGRCATTELLAWVVWRTFRVDRIFMPLGLEEVVTKPLALSPPCPTFKPELMHVVVKVVLAPRKWFDEILPRGTRECIW